jgi:hypothetical protein
VVAGGRVDGHQPTDNYRAERKPLSLLTQKGQGHGKDVERKSPETGFLLNLQIPFKARDSHVPVALLYLVFNIQTLFVSKTDTVTCQRFRRI